MVAQRDVILPIPATIQTILLYGPEEGLAQERLERIAHAWCRPGTERHRLSWHESSPESLSALTATGLFSSRHFVVLQQQNTVLSTAWKDYLTTPTSDALYVIMAGTLPPSSALRRFAEQHPSIWSIPCYTLTTSQTAAYVRRWIEEAGLDYEPLVPSLCAAKLPGSLHRLKQELDKIILYVGAKRMIRERDVEEILLPSETIALEDSTLQLWLRPVGARMALFDQMLANGLHPIPIIKACRRIATRLHELHSLLAQGGDFKQAASALRPPLFFTAENAYRNLLDRHSPAQLLQHIQALSSLEADCKSLSHSGAIVIREFLRTAL